MITNKETGWTEAEVIINGKPLSFAEAMTLRVAVSHFYMWLSGDEVERDMADLGIGYKSKLDSIEHKMRGK